MIALNILYDKTKLLMRKTQAKEGDTIDAQTAYLLANKGFDPNQIKSQLMEIDLGLTFEPLHGVADTDVEGYLRNEHENLISNRIEEQKKSALLDFERSFENAIQRDWDQAKRKIMEEMGHQSHVAAIDMEMQYGLLIIPNIQPLLLIP